MIEVVASPTTQIIFCERVLMFCKRVYKRGPRLYFHTASPRLREQIHSSRGDATCVADSGDHLFVVA